MESQTAQSIGLTADDQAISDSVARRLGHPLTRFEAQNAAADRESARRMSKRERDGSCSALSAVNKFHAHYEADTLDAQGSVY